MPDFTVHIVAHRYILSPTTRNAVTVVCVCSEAAGGGVRDRQTDRQRQTVQIFNGGGGEGVESDRQKQTEGQIFNKVGGGGERDRQTDRQTGQIFNNVFLTIR